MADVVSAEKRSQMMGGIRGKDTKPELLIRKDLHRHGFRYILHDKRLPGKPDIVLPKHKAIILVHGCFWHGHNCSLFKWPTSHEDFWASKIHRNKELDATAESALLASGWRCAIVWECSIKGRRKRGLNTVMRSCIEWLNSDRPRIEIREY
jgi:DNA mismatch endonuclease (patch repair protein)